MTRTTKPNKSKKLFFFVQPETNTSILLIRAAIKHSIKGEKNEIHGQRIFKLK